MQATSGSWPDWRDAGAYAPLHDADRSLFAWEWLRRDPDYIAAATASAPVSGLEISARFGLVRLEAPQRAVPDARPLWAASSHPPVLTLTGRAELAPDDAFDLERFGAVATLAACGVNEHLLLSDGWRTVRLDGPAGSFTKGPGALRYRLEGVAAAERPLLTLRRFVALCRTGRFSRLLHRREPLARRWILMLRAYDALLAGAAQREIARELFSSTADEPLWRSRESSVRSQAQRLVRSARQFAGGGYRLLLG